MGMVVVVVAEPTQDVAEHGICRVELRQIDVVTLEGLYERLGHPVRLRRGRGRRADPFAPKEALYDLHALIDALLTPSEEGGFARRCPISRRGDAAS